jgi:hypothetical protein
MRNKQYQYNQLLKRSAGMAKLADAADLKSAGPKGLWGFDSPSRHQSVPLANVNVPIPMFIAQLITKTHDG